MPGHRSIFNRRRSLTELRRYLDMPPSIAISDSTGWSDAFERFRSK